MAIKETSSISVILLDGLVSSKQKLSAAFTTANISRSNGNVCPLKDSSSSNINNAAAAINPLRSARVYRLCAQDAAVGACVLSAAELDSSKLYKQTESACQLAYLVSK